MIRYLHRNIASSSPNLQGAVQHVGSFRHEKIRLFWNYAAGFVSQEQLIWFSKPCWLGHAISPLQYRQFFSELARCSPACGIFQTWENQAVFEIMQQVLSSQEQLIWFSKPCWLGHAPAVCTKSFYMQRPKVELRVHPMLSVNYSHTSWMCVRHRTQSTARSFDHLLVGPEAIQSTLVDTK